MEPCDAFSASIVQVARAAGAAGQGSSAGAIASAVVATTSLGVARAIEGSHPDKEQAQTELQEAGGVVHEKSVVRRDRVAVASKARALPKIRQHLRVGVPSGHMDDDSLSELATFAQAYPARASELAEPGLDPDVESLAEGFEYLAAKVRRIVDRGTLDLVEPLADLLCPELLRPLPSATIVQLATTRHRSKRITIAAGAELGSLPIDGTSCVFRAMSAFDIVPWNVTDVRAEWSAAEGQSVVLELTTGDVDDKPRPLPIGTLFPLRLHFASEAVHDDTLLFWFCQRLAAIELRIGEDGPRATLPVAALRPWGLERAEALLPIESHEHPGFRLLREYFLMPQKFAFAELAHPGDGELGSAARVSLVFRFESHFPVDMRITRESILLNCVPVVNIFDATSDPIRPSLEAPLHALRVAGVAMEHAEIHTIRGAYMRLAGEGEARPIAPLGAFGVTPGEGLRGASYAVHRAPSRRPESDFLVSLGMAAESGPLPEIDVASFDLWATNGTLAGSLGIGAVCVPMPWARGHVSFCNIRAVTPYVPAPRGGARRDRATAFLARTEEAYDTAGLRRLLRCLNPHGLTRTQAGRAEALGLAAIESATSIPGRMKAKGALVRGQEIEVVLGQGTFRKEGEVLVLAAILDRLYGHETALGTFSRTTVRWRPTGLVLRFPPRSGDRRLD